MSAGGGNAYMVLNPALLTEIGNDPEMAHAVGLVTGQVAARARANCISPQVAATIDMEMIHWSTGWFGRVIVGHFLGNIIEFGAGAHVILPKNRKALASSGFGPVAVIDHPGMDAAPFLRPAAEGFGKLRARRT